VISSIRLPVGKEICGERRQVVGPSISITLSPGSIVLEDNHGTAPGLGSSTRGDAKDCLINWSIRGQRARRIPQLEGKTQRLSIQTLRYDDVVDLSPSEILLDERNRACALSRCVRRLARYANDSRSI
jgi:hypothetical protein